MIAAEIIMFEQRAKTLARTLADQAQTTDSLRVDVEKRIYDASFLMFLQNEIRGASLTHQVDSEENGEGYRVSIYRPRV